MLDLTKRLQPLSEPLYHWLLNASRVLDGLSSQISVSSGVTSFAGSLSYAGGRVFTREPPLTTGSTPSIFAAPALSFVPNKSHVVVSIVHADDGTDRAEFKITATFKSDATGAATGLTVVSADVLSATAGASTWTATLSDTTVAGVLTMDGANATAGTEWTVNSQFSRAA
jgi:hypothetical protein